MFTQASAISASFKSPNLQNPIDSQEGRQNISVIFTTESGEHIDVEKINTWVRNHKDKKRRLGERDPGRVVPKERDNSHLSHGEIVWVTTDHDILSDDIQRGGGEGDGWFLKLEISVT